MSWWLLGSAAATVWIAINAVIIVMQRRPAASTIAWLLALVFLPVLGLLLYRFIGPLKLERKKRKRTSAKRIVDEGARGLAALDATGAHHQLAMVPIRLGGAPPLRAETVDFYFDGASAYEAILAAVAAARDHVHLEYYIWEPDTIGTKLRDLLIERARDGVKVRVLVDGTGSHHLSRKFLRPLREAGATVAWFNPVRLFTLRRKRADFRSHRKIVVVDGRVGFTGGMNITDLHSAALSKAYWRDTHVKLTGVAVWPIQRVFFEDWYYAAGELIAISDKTVPPPQLEGEHLVQIVASGPDASTFDLHKVFFTAISQATERVWLTTPYFVPDDALLTALITAALRGVDVRVIVPAKGDSKLVDLAARSYFPELLEARVRVFEYTPRFVHAKTMVVDRDVTIAGTCNFDNRSFRLDFELAALVFGAPANTTLADQFTLDATDCRELSAADLTRLPFHVRLGQSSARLLSPLL
ncbi:MAG TPA: cardiolipin synthase [Kofleriaceae bacterium]|nr:cardiolipin synthase [Kofleriaceae bacterium]